MGNQKNKVLTGYYENHQIIQFFNLISSLSLQFLHE